MDSLHSEISEFCASIGRDALLVQGAGGNVSWKQGDVLWVKGSGTWLANATIEDIFAPVDLAQLKLDLSLGKFNISPKVIGEHPLRPSIETILHALMPQKIVIHLHLIQALVHLVCRNSEKTIEALYAQSSEKVGRHAYVKYCKPGEELAREISKVLASEPEVNIVFLKNHGVVLGADSIQSAQALLASTLSVCGTTVSNSRNSRLQSLPLIKFETEEGYIPFPDIQVHALSIDPSLFRRLSTDWVLYPDHAVFLGPNANTFTSWSDFISKQQSINETPELIFIENKGVFTKPSFNKAKIAQLRCYYEVLTRVNADAVLDPLKDTDIKALLGWDAEQFRQQMAM